MTSSLGLSPAALALQAAVQSGSAEAITAALSVITESELSSFCTALGPIAVANMIPAFIEATGSNMTGGLGTAMNHLLLAASTTAANATYAVTDGG